MTLLPYILLIILLSGGAPVIYSEPCSAEDTAVVSSRASRGNPGLSGMSETCVCSLLALDETRREGTPAVRAHIEGLRVGDTLLFCAWRNHKVREDESLFSMLFRSWRKSNSSSAAVLSRFENGNARRTDTLFMILDNRRELDFPMILEWIGVKQILGDQKSTAALFHRAIRERPQLTPLVLNRFERTLLDLDANETDSLLVRFHRLVSPGREDDNRAIREWILDQYGAKRLYERQIGFLFETEHETLRREEQLAALAETRLRKRLFIPASSAAAILYRTSAEKEMRRKSAGILYESYQSRGMRDSARIWLGRAGTLPGRNISGAIELYQQTGEYEKASGLIRTLAPSLARDTLRVRQLLLTDSTAAALELTGSEKTMLARSEAHHRLWRIRTLLLTGNTGECRAQLDSLRLDPAGPGTRELLEYRYWLQRLSDSPEALAKFITIEYTIFKGDRNGASRLLCTANLDSVHTLHIGLRIARRQIESGEAASALTTLNCIPAAGDPEYLYRLAEAGARTGDRNTAQKLLTRLLMDFPESVYASQGRILLAQLRRK